MPMPDRSKMKRGGTRRTLLKGAAGVAGLAAGSGAITGFPYVHSAEPKVLRYLGTAGKEGNEVLEKGLADSRINVEYITGTTEDGSKRVMTPPNYFRGFGTVIVAS